MEANRCVGSEERVATFDVHTQVGTFKAERETKLRDVTMPKNREGEHAFLERSRRRPSPTRRGRASSRSSTRSRTRGAARTWRASRAVLIKKKAEETQALAA